MFIILSFHTVESEPHKRMFLTLWAYIPEGVMHSKQSHVCNMSDVDKYYDKNKQKKSLGITVWWRG